MRIRNRLLSTLPARFALGVALACGTGAAAAAKTITIKIGIQDMCTDTYAGGTAMKGLKILPKYLPHTGKYKGVTYKIVWQNYASGAPITQMMMAGKLDFGVMGDYPLIVNGARFQATQNERSYLIALTDYNLDGAGNAIVVPEHSPITNASQLVGKTISTPVGSASWGMLFEMAADKHIPIDKLHIINQDPMLGITEIANDKVAAHADFCPVSEYIEYKKYGRIIYSGAETGVPYLHGVVVTKSFAQKYPKIVVGYIEALIATERWISANPYAASKKMGQFSMIPKEVLYLYFSKGGYLVPGTSFNPVWIKTLKYDHGILRKYAKIPKLDFTTWMKPSYMKTAYAAMHMDYAKDVAATPVSPKQNIGMPPELWIKGAGISRYPSIAAMLDALKAAKDAHKTIEASYVYDAATGIKLFGNYANYVKAPNGSISAYMTLDEANRNRSGGTVLSFSQVIAQPPASQKGA